MKLFVSAIGTDSGKTLVSGLLAAGLGWPYHKPVQAGQPTDAEWVASHLPQVAVLPSRVVLATPASPHHAAAREGLELTAAMLQLATLPSPCVVEGAGGLLVPLNAGETMLQVAQACDAVLLVSNYYLGSINHTLLSMQVLAQAGLPCLGLVLNGEPMPGTRDYFEQVGLPIVYDLPRLNVADAQQMQGHALALASAVRKAGMWPAA